MRAARRPAEAVTKRILAERHSECCETDPVVECAHECCERVEPREAWQGTRRRQAGQGRGHHGIRFASQPEHSIRDNGRRRVAEGAQFRPQPSDPALAAHDGHGNPNLSSRQRPEKLDRN
jgi:hypothetical protein